MLLMMEAVTLTLSPFRKAPDPHQAPPGSGNRCAHTQALHTQPVDWKLEPALPQAPYKLEKGFCFLNSCFFKLLMQTKVQNPHNWWEKILLPGTMPRKNSKLSFLLTLLNCWLPPLRHDAIWCLQAVKPATSQQRQGFSWAKSLEATQGE